MHWDSRIIIINMHNTGNIYILDPFFYVLT